MYLQNDVLLCGLSDKCTLIHFSEDNPVFDREFIFLSPLILLKAIEKQDCNFNFSLNSPFKQRFYFCYLTFQRENIKFYRQVYSVNGMNSYYWSTILKKFGRDLIYSRSLGNIYLKSYQLLLHCVEQNPHIHFESSFGRGSFRHSESTKFE